MNLSDSEHELINILRSGKTFRLDIQYRGRDDWSVTTAPALPERHPQTTGAGHTFAAAWVASGSGVASW